MYLVKLEEIVRVILDDEHVVLSGQLLKYRGNILLYNELWLQEGVIEFIGRVCVQ